MINSCNTYIIKANNYVIREETFEGKAQIVVPVVMMTEGVHCGSAGAVFHSIEQLGKYPGAWNGIPVCISHPQAEGSFISANSPEIIEAQTVGRIFHTFIDGKKLKAECWIDVEKIKNVSPPTFEMLKNMAPLEVSIGVFSDDLPEEGTWNGEDYVMVATNHRPDHLALLPGERGACSWSDGAGIRANSKDTKEVNNLDKKKQKPITTFIATCTSEGFRATVMKIQNKLNAFDTTETMYYLEDCYEDGSFVYSVSSVSGETKYYEKSYSMEASGDVSFSAEAVPVVREVKYRKFTANTAKEGVKGKMDKMTEETKAHVDSLIESGKFTDEQRESLESVDAELLGTFASMLIVDEVAEETPVVNSEEAKPTVFTKEDAIAVLHETLQTPEQCLSIFPEEMQDQLRSGLKLHQAQKEALITSIIGYNKSYTEEELRTRSMDELTKMASFVPESKADFSIFGINRTQSVSTNAEKPLIPVGVVGMIEEKK